MKAFDSMCENGQDNMLDSLSTYALSAGSTCREQLQCFGDGSAKLEDLDEALILACRFKFMPVVERYVEGLHARVHRHAKMAPCFGPCTVAWQFAQQALVNKIEEGGAEFTQELATACREVQNIMDAVELFGFRDHPVVQRLVAEIGHGKLLNQARPDLLNVLFHADPPTLYQTLPALRQPGAFCPQNGDSNKVCCDKPL